MSKIIDRIIETVKYNFGIIPEEDFYIDDHIDKGNLSVVKKLIEKNPNLINYKDCFENSPLHIAAQENQVDIAFFLIENGANVNDKEDIGQTPLHVAVTFKNKGIIELLIKNGSDVNAKDNSGDTPLALADKDLKEFIINLK